MHAPPPSLLACSPESRIGLHRCIALHAYMAQPATAMAVPASNATTIQHVVVDHRRHHRWRSSLASGLRTALACAIVGVVSVYAPPAVRRHITFPAFSYVVTVIIVTDATVGTALRAAVAAMQATVMGAVPSVLALWLAHRTGAAESAPATAAVVALSTFAVALPESSALAKRIALGQIIIIYVARFRRGEHPGRSFALLHPANVVACTALGVAAALLAVLLPCPRLATREAAEKGRAYAEMAAERVRLLVDAFAFSVAGDGAGTTRRRAPPCMASQAKRLATASARLLLRVSTIKGDMQWEQLPMMKHCWATPAEQLQPERVEMPLRGMEIALAATRSSAIVDLRWLKRMRDQTRLALLTHGHHPCATAAAGCGDGDGGMIKHSVSGDMEELPESSKELPPLLFAFSLYLLHRGTTEAGDLSSQDKMMFHTTKVMPAASQEEEEEGDEQFKDLEEGEEAAAGEVEEGDEEEPKQQLGSAATAPKRSTVMTKKKKKKAMAISRSSLVAAVKCAVSLGVAVLLGLLFSGDHGFWSGLIVATTMAVGRESTWALAAARAHGTALGSVYGALACVLVSQRLMELRFLALLPWVVLATFLKRSRAYGPAGGVAAALSVIIIVGRRYDEPPMAFTVARLVETFIGLTCAVTADLAFQPAGRPSARARAQLARCLGALRDCLAGAEADDASPSPSPVQEQVALLRKCVAEARNEPTFLWLPPFPAACYDKVEASMSKMAQLLWLYLQARGACRHRHSHGEPPLLHLQDIQRFHRIVSTSLDRLCIQDPNSPTAENSDSEVDLEAGKPSSHCEEEAAAISPETVVRSFLASAREALPQQHGAEEGDDKGKQQLQLDNDHGLVVACLGSVGLCLGEMVKEVLQLEAHMLELKLLQT